MTNWGHIVYDRMIQPSWTLVGRWGFSRAPAEYWNVARDVETLVGQRAQRTVARDQGYDAKLASGETQVWK